MNESDFFSLKQYQEQAKKNIENITETITDLNVVSKSHKVESVKIDVSKHLLEKILFLTSELLNNEDNLLNFAATLRFSFETLIHTKLFFKEKEHILRIRYSLFTHQKDKFTKLIKRIEEEILLLKEIESFEKQHLKLSIDEIDKLIEEKFGSNITMFFEGVKFNGYGYHQSVLKQNVLKPYRDKLIENETKKKDFEQKIVKNKYFQEIFGIKIQHNQVEKKLFDERSWNEKSKFVNLEKEYNLMYDITSSLIHSTSYSLLTNKEMVEQEKKTYYNLLNQYVKQINENIRLFCLIDFFLNQNVKHINLVAEKKENINIDSKKLKMNGFCPQCLFLDKKKSSMKINSSDYFECPMCNLQILNISENKVAAILPQRGKGNILSNYSSEVYLKNYYLSTAKMEEGIAKPEFIFFQSPNELKEYLESIK